MPSNRPVNDSLARCIKVTFLQRILAIVFIPAILFACSQHQASSPGLPPAAGAAQTRAGHPPFIASDKIKHVVFIIQENRTFDNIFGGPKPLPGADTVQSGVGYDGSTIRLKPQPIENPGLTACCDPNNYHAQWLRACNAPSGMGPPFTVGLPAPCRMNGFSLNASPQPGYPTPPTGNGHIFSFVEYSETTPYFFIAKNYAVGDHFFMGHNSESYTGHQYIFSSQSNDTVDAPVFPSNVTCTGLVGAWHLMCAFVPWGCDSPPNTGMYFIDPKSGNEVGPPNPPSTTPPCFDTTTKIPYYSLADRVSQKKLSWRMYTRSMCSGIVGLDANLSIRNSTSWPNTANTATMKNCYNNYGFKKVLGSDKLTFRVNEQKILDDETGKLPLANLTYVLPGPFTSDHPGVPGAYCGPTWVADVVNAIGKNTADWNSTVIFILWDDWGGFYDHVPPYVVRDQTGPGFRVPLLVVSPYVRRGVVHTNIEFATLNKFVESTFGLASLNATDATPYLHNLNDFFDFNSPPKPFVKVPSQGFSTCKLYIGNGRREPRLNAKQARWLRLVGDD
jgi:phospholipase C